MHSGGDGRTAVLGGAGHTAGLLEGRLKRAEDETERLSGALEALGHPSGPQPQLPVAQTPFKDDSSPENALVNNYQLLVSRTCRLESVLQSLKLSMCSLQAEKDLSRKLSSGTNEKLVIALEAYDREIQKNKRILEDLRFDKKNLEEDLQSTKTQLEERNKELVELTIQKEQSVVGREEAEQCKGKLSRRVSELRAELEREAGLRASLEDSQAALLARVRDMETTVQQEREQVSNLSSGSSAVKKELVQLQDELKSESALRRQAEALLNSQQATIGEERAAVCRLEKEKRLLMTETGKVKALYKDMNQQLAALHKAFQDKQAGFLALDLEKKELTRALEAARQETADLRDHYQHADKASRERERAELEGQDTVIEIRERLRKEGRERDALDKQCDVLKAQLEKVEKEYRDYMLLTETQLSGAREQAGRAGRQVRELQEEKERTLLSKDSLLNEVNAAVEEMSRQRADQAAELEATRLEIDVLQKIRSQLEEDNSRLQERTQTLQTQQTCHEHVDSALKDLLEQKNKLAYDKGRLQAKVDQLQGELESLAQAQTETMQLRKQTQTLEAKYTKAHTDLQTVKMALAQSETQLSLLKTEGGRKERDFALALSSRDEAMKEVDRLVAHVEAVEDRERGKVCGLQQSLAESRAESDKMAATLETVIQSHAQLQLAIEQLQLQLGRRDADILKLGHDREQNRCLFDQMKAQLEEATEKLTNMETYESKEVEPLRVGLEESRGETVKLTAQLATLTDQNQQLNDKVRKLENELEQQAYLAEQQRAARTRDQEESAKQVNNYEERIKNLKQQLKKERDKTIAKNNKDINDLRRVQDELTCKNGELSRANSELRKKLTESEECVKERKTRLASQKAQLEQLMKTKKNQEEQIDTLKKSVDRLQQVEKVKDKYVKKHQTQAETIKSFTGQLCELQDQLRAFADRQGQTQQTIREQRQQMDELVKQNQQLANMWQVEKRSKAELAALSQQMSAKLQASADTHPDQVPVRDETKDADVIFTEKVKQLQHELQISKEVQDRFAEEAVEQYRILEEEKRRARDIAEQAQHMLQSNRASMCRIAEAAELNKVETRQDLQEVYDQLAREKIESKKKDEKIRRLKKSSARQMEELARSLTPDNSRLSPRTSSPFYESSP